MGDETYAIETKSLNYSFRGPRNFVLKEINLKIPWGTTNILIGPNGAGKSTLLRILAGKTLIKAGSLLLNGTDPFVLSSESQKRNSEMNRLITYLGTEWASNPVVKHDIQVKDLIASVGGNVYSDRRDTLIILMDVDPEWSMAFVSDGERRRVQLVMGLLKPWRLLLLDEVTVDLDVVVRQNLLNFLRQECLERNCCVVYATHIFDGLARAMCDRVIHIASGQVKEEIPSDEIQYVNNGEQQDNNKCVIPLSESLHPLALKWLRDDFANRSDARDVLHNKRKVHS